MEGIWTYPFIDVWLICPLTWHFYIQTKNHDTEFVQSIVPSNVHGKFENDLQRKSLWENTHGGGGGGKLMCRAPFQ